MLSNLAAIASSAKFLVNYRVLLKLENCFILLTTPNDN